MSAPSFCQDQLTQPRDTKLVDLAPVHQSRDSASRHQGDDVMNRRLCFGWFLVGLLSGHEVIRISKITYLIYPIIFVGNVKLTNSINQQKAKRQKENGRL